ncbi:MAG: 4-hydroxy-3-methylbut-2-enyl diphosphate reductase [Candidatus Gastranaerophilales bacterium]|nr:4-hydroxy-3-methylbut-2-enyl diphosphate reductase [Candidatus Gastranaerophilales bacterium]
MTLQESWSKTITKTIKLAKNAGFCYGVKRAVDTTKKLKQENPNKTISVLGELIHNSHVTTELENLGIKTIKTLPEAGEGICVIRSHGESDDTFKEIQSKGYEIVDLTCLDVKKVQSKAVEMVLDGYFVIILGKYDHPEVSAIYINAKNQAQDINNVFVAQNLEALKAIESKIKQAKKVGIVLQTTQTKEYLLEVVDYLSTICKILKIQNTICPSTTLRQEEAKKLGKESDLMIVVGSKKSANTTHLAEILKDITKTIHIEHQDELENYLDEIAKAQNIGVTAGASTPETIINAVIDKLENIN